MNGEILHRAGVAVACPDGQAADAEQIVKGLLEGSVYSRFLKYRLLE